MVTMDKEKLVIHKIQVSNEIFDILDKIRLKKRLKNRESVIRYLLIELNYLEE